MKSSSEKSSVINSSESLPTKNYYVLISRLPTEAKLQLAPGITLSPLTCDISVFDLAAAGAVGFKEWAMLEPFAHQLLSEVESAVDSAVTPGYDALGRVWLANALLSLQGLDQHLAVACNSYSWERIAGRSRSLKRPARFPDSDKLLPFEGGILDFHLRTWSVGARKTITKNEAGWVYKNFNTYNSLTASSEKFRLALEACIDWRYSKDQRSAIARIWCGIEALCGISSELVYRISLICSSLLEEKGQKRLDKFSSIKQLYNFRSKAVHGESLTEKQMTETMLESYNLLRDLIVKSAQLGHVFSEEDFNQAIFF